MIVLVSKMCMGEIYKITNDLYKDESFLVYCVKPSHFLSTVSINEVHLDTGISSYGGLGSVIAADRFWSVTERTLNDDYTVETVGDRTVYLWLESFLRARRQPNDPYSVYSLRDSVLALWPPFAAVALFGAGSVGPAASVSIAPTTDGGLNACCASSKESGFRICQRCGMPLGV